LRCIAEQPTLAGGSLSKQQNGELVQAKSIYCEILAQDPSDSDAWHLLGMVFYAVSEFSTALECLHKANRFAPNQPHILANLGLVLRGLGDLESAKLHLSQAVSLAPQSINCRTNLGTVLSELKEWKAAIKQFDAVLLLEAHDHELVETFCYAEVPAPDEMTKILRGLSSHWRSTVGLSDHQVARQIKADEIDILVDLAGHTAGNRLRTFAFRPAPIQVTWLGYPNTTGLEAIDYRLSCEAQSPTGEADYHTEQIVRMKHGSSCFSINTDAPPVAPSPLVAQGYPTFGALHRPDKISPLVRELWAAVLQAIPDSRLLLFHTRFSDQSAELVRSDLIRLGVTKNRIEIRNRTDAASYLSTYHEIDIALDVTPWAGSTTTLEALWMGVPVIALLGKRRSARSTAVILHQVGLPELIATDIPDYVRIANSLAGDVSRLTAIRSNLRERMNMTVCNAGRFTRELEREYRTMWHDWCLPHGKKSA